MNGNTRSISSIEREMQDRGFPELELNWRKFVSTGTDPAGLSNQKISALRDRHMALLFGHPWIVGAALLCVSGFLALWFERGIALLVLSLANFGSNSPLSGLPPLVPGRISVFWCLFLVGKTVGIFGLCAYLTLMLQRYFVYSFEKISALDLGLMLSRENFRTWFEKTTEAQAVRERLGAAGVNNSWDDPDYRARYQPGEDGWQRAQTKSDLEFVLDTLREFLGYKDPELRKHVPGSTQAA